MKYWNYDKLAEIYDITRSVPLELSIFFTHEIHDFIKNKSFPPPYRLLSIGLGTGRIESLLSSKAYQLFGIDISSAMLMKLKQKNLNPPCYPIQADGFSLPFAKFFHILILLQVIHLISDHEKFFNEIQKYCQVFVIGEVYTETQKHPYYVKFLEFLRNNGMDKLRDDMPKSSEFNKLMDKFSIQNLKIYEGIKKRHFSSFWEIENGIFDRSMADLNQFILENHIEKKDFFPTYSKAKLTFFEMN